MAGHTVVDLNFVNDKLEELLKRYSEKQIVDENRDSFFSDVKNISIENPVDCTYKDTCYASKFNNCDCPCELRR